MKKNKIGKMWFIKLKINKPVKFTQKLKVLIKVSKLLISWSGKKLGMRRSCLLTLKKATSFLICLLFIKRKVCIF